MFEFGVISDEISSDFEHACRFIKEWNLQHVDLRTLPSHEY